MSATGTVMKQHAVDRFWHKYLSSLKRMRAWDVVALVLQAAWTIHCRPYRRQISVSFTVFINEYLIAKGRLKHLQEWQFRQIVDATRLACCNFMYSDRATNKRPHPLQDAAFW